MTTSKGRIAQTFPDINSSGLTVATSAGVRSFPEPFIAIPGGVDVLIQNRSVTLAAGALTFVDALPTSVDITKSFIQFRGLNVSTSTTSPNAWRTRISFSGIVGSTASSVTTFRRQTGITAIDVYYTVVAFLGSATTSADMRVENCDFTVAAPSTSGSCPLPGGQLTTAELARSFCFVRGIEFDNQPPVLGDPCSSGTGTACWKHPEQQRGTIRMHNSGPDTLISYSRFTPGSPIGPDHCGSSNVDVYVTAVIFP